MKSKQPIPFASYEPDKGRAGGAGQLAKGVLSASGRYVPLPELVVYRTGGQINDACLGGAGFYDHTGSPAVFMGDTGRLYQVVDRVPSDVSASGGYAVDPDWQWSFAQFGNNILAAGRGAALQRFELGTSSAFAAIPGAPVAEVVFRIRQHMFACSGRDVAWSAFNDITSWAASSETQAGFTTVGQEAGIVVAGIGGEQGALFQERGIIRIAYQGGEVPWFFDEIEGGRGACSPGAVRPWARGAFCMAEDGAYFWDGLNAEPIGQDKIDRMFSADLNYAYRGRVTSAIDTQRKSWTVAYPSGSSSVCNKVLVYSWADKRWTHDEIDVQAMFDMPKDGVSADDEAAIIATAGTAEADLITLSADSPAWRESRREWACVDATRTLKTFSGPPRKATLETGQFEPIPGQIAHISEVSPLIDAEPGHVFASIYAREYRMGQREELQDTAGMDELGICPVRAEGRFVRAQVVVTAGAPWTEAIGVHWDGESAGER